MSIKINIRTVILFCLFFIIGVIGVFVFEHGNYIPRVFVPTSYFSLQNPPRNSLKGEILSLSGDVSWESRIATEASKITKSQIIRQGESISTGKNGKVNIGFPKRVIFSLGSSSNLNIIQTLPQNIVTEETMGNVEYTTTGLSPFSVKTLGLLINATSAASFKVKLKDAQVYIFLSSGSLVLAYTDTSNTSQVINLKAEKNIIYENNTKEIINSL